MNVELRLPNITGITEKEQIAQIRSYLYQLIPVLQWGLNGIGSSPCIKISKRLDFMRWYKIGTISGETCAVATLIIGGLFGSPSMVDVATQHNLARVFLRLPALDDNQISKIGVIKESDKAYGVYAYFNSENQNAVSINVHIHMGSFASVNLASSYVSEKAMISVVTLKG